MTLGIVRGLSCLATFSGDDVDPVVTFGRSMDHGLEGLGATHCCQAVPCHRRLLS